MTLFLVGERYGSVMKMKSSLMLSVVVFAFLFGPDLVFAQEETPSDLRELLWEALFEEEASRDLKKAGRGL